MASGGVDVAIVVNSQTDAISAGGDLFEVDAAKGAVLADGQLVLLAGAAVHADEGAWATARRRSV